MVDHKWSVMGRGAGHGQLGGAGPVEALVDHGGRGGGRGRAVRAVVPRLSGTSGLADGCGCGHHSAPASARIGTAVCIAFPFLFDLAVAVAWLHSRWSLGRWPLLYTDGPSGLSVGGDLLVNTAVWMMMGVVLSPLLFVGILGFEAFDRARPKARRFARIAVMVALIGMSWFVYLRLRTRTWPMHVWFAD